MPEGIQLSPPPQGVSPWRRTFRFRRGGLAALWRQIVQLSKSKVHLALLCLVAAGCGSGAVIVNDLDEREANEMIVLLNRHDIDAQKIANVSGTGGSQTVTWNLSVPSSKRIESLSTLNVNGLPRRRSPTLLELFSKQGLVSSQMEEDVRYQAGLADQIANTIRKIDGVLDTDVQLSIPQQDAIPGQTETKPVTASVYVKHSGVLDDPNRHLEIKIKRLVSGSIPGLSFDNVTVIGDSTLDQSNTLQIGPTPEDLMTRVWGIDLAKKSTRSLRLLVGSCITIIALLGFFLVWLMWKLQKILTSPSGVHSIFSLKPLELATAAPEAGVKEKSEPETASAPADTASSAPPPARPEPAKGPPPGSGPLRSQAPQPQARPGP